VQTPVLPNSRRELTGGFFMDELSDALYIPDIFFIRMFRLSLRVVSVSAPYQFIFTLLKLH
jgi:hypothetical protein